MAGKLEEGEEEEEDCPIDPGVATAYLDGGGGGETEVVQAHQRNLPIIPNSVIFSLNLTAV